MAVAYNTRVVTDGLVLALDAGNTKSYPGSGTTWTDLSGRGNNGTLVGPPTYSSLNGGSLVFDGFVYVTPTGLTDTFLQSNWTASFWVKFDTLETNNITADDKIMFQHGTSATRQGLNLAQRDSKIIFGLFGDNLSGTITVSTGTWYNIVFTLNNSTYVKQNYLNGVFDNSEVSGGPYVGTGNNARIAGKVLTSGVPLDGRMSSCSFYNRVLTASEISQNFNALRGRFGI